jgi:hypothetical protein
MMSRSVFWAALTRRCRDMVVAPNRSSPKVLAGSSCATQSEYSGSPQPAGTIGEVGSSWRGQGRGNEANDTSRGIGAGVGRGGRSRRVCRQAGRVSRGRHRRRRQKRRDASGCGRRGDSGATAAAAPSHLSRDLGGDRHRRRQLPGCRIRHCRRNLRRSELPSYPLRPPRQRGGVAVRRRPVPGPPVRHPSGVGEPGRSTFPAQWKEGSSTAAVNLPRPEPKSEPTPLESSHP